MDSHHELDDENVYDALATADDDGRWAFGTGFDAGTAALTAIDAPAPEGVDRDDLEAYCLMLADDALIAAQRLAGWTAKAPELEEDVALANIALDLLGQARVLLARAGHLGAAERFRVAGAHDDEDVLAYFRDDRFFRNVVLADGRWRDEALGFDRAFLFFDEERVADARTAWKSLAEREGVMRNYWKQKPGGGWEKAA